MSGATTPDGRGLEVDRLGVRYGDLVAVDDVTLSVAPGEVLAVLGPSGCGKSTLLRAAAGLEPVAAGAVRWDAGDLAGVPPHRRGFGLVFQDGQLFPHLDVAGNVGYPLRIRRRPAAERHDRVAHLLEAVGLTGYERRAPGELSGGERQRVALARALAVRPRLLLLDEPLASLDRDLRERLADDLARVLREEGTAAVLVTHDADEAFTVADRMAVMRAGRLVQQGTLSQVWRRPADPETARFLGYARLVDPVVARRLGAAETQADSQADTPGAALAMRRSALRLDATGPVRGVVREARSDAVQTRLVVVVDEPEGLGEVDAVADWADRVGVGDRVRLRLDPERTAWVGEQATPGS